MARLTSLSLILRSLASSRLVTVRLLSVATLLLPSISSSYPRTILKGYRTCGVCHNTPSGGTALTDYGRKVVEEWSTFSINNEMLEAVRYNFKNIDYKLRLRTLHSPEINIPMVADLEIAGYWRRMVIDLQGGFYSRTMILESRQYFLGFSPVKGFQLRSGYFFPAIGLLTNDHSLPIKKFMGLGRGSEAYTTELWLWRKKFGQTFLSVSSNEQLSRTIRARLSLFLGKKSELGLSLQGNNNLDIVGAFIRFSRWGTYTLYEVNRRLSGDQVYHLRWGFYPLKGLDVNVSRDEQLSGTNYIGVNWMVRPGFEFSFKGSQDSWNFQMNLFR